MGGTYKTSIFSSSNFIIYMTTATFRNTVVIMLFDMSYTSQGEWVLRL